MSQFHIKGGQPPQADDYDPVIWEHTTYLPEFGEVTTYVPLSIITVDNEIIKVSPSKIIIIPHRPYVFNLMNFTYDTQNDNVTLYEMNHIYDFLPYVKSYEAIFTDLHMYYYWKALGTQNSTYIFEQHLIPYVNFHLESMSNYETGTFWSGSSQQDIYISSDPAYMWNLSGFISGKYRSSNKVEHYHTSTSDGLLLTYRCKYTASTNDYPLNIIFVPGSYQRKEVYRSKARY